MDNILLSRSIVCFNIYSAKSLDLVWLQLRQYILPTENQKKSYLG